MNRHLHIISSTAPWPADNSTAIDILNTIKILHQQSVKIHLHYFCNLEGRHPTELNQYCETIHLYKVDTDIKDYESVELIDRLNKDNCPILIGALSFVQQLKKITNSNRRVIVRIHKNSQLNAEKKSTNFIAKLFRRTPEIETSKRLPPNFRYIFSNEDEANSFRIINDSPEIHYLPFLSYSQTVTSETGIGNFCLYHGDLSDASNKMAVLWLIEKVFNDINTPLVIAGKNPGRQLIKMAELFSHICMVSNPSGTEMDELIRKAQINVLPSFSSGKPELKLIHALLMGRHCVTNTETITDTVFSDACHAAKNPAAFKSIILQLYRRPFEEDEIELRKRIFRNLATEQPDKLLIKWLYE